MRKINRPITLVIMLFCISSVLAGGPRPIVPAEGYQHDKFKTEPRDIVKEFRAYITSFDGKDNNVALGIPEWVAYEVRKAPIDLGKAPGRPSVWFTDEKLFKEGIAPNDDTYKEPKYSRGHMCMKSLAWRLGADADYNTHTVFNACPQLQGINAGVWEQLEELTGKWADDYGQIWVICGPVFLKKQIQWIGDEGEVKAAIPDAFYKIVVKQSPSNPSPNVLAFIFPHADTPILRSKSGNLVPYLTSVDIIEALTGIDFLTVLDDPVEDRIEQEMATELWVGDLPAIVTGTAPNPSEVAAAPKTKQIEQAQKQEQTVSQVKLREGIEPTKDEIEIASKLVSLGWEYCMPSPKSAKAMWGKSDARTTWWKGYWINNQTGKLSSTQPKNDNDYQGDGVDPRGWRRGGSPRCPNAVEWLCSKTGGIKPQ